MKDTSETMVDVKVRRVLDEQNKRLLNLSDRLDEIYRQLKEDIAYLELKLENA